MLQRILGVLKLDVATFEEIEHDENATTQAAIIVAIVAILSAIGAYIGAVAANAALANLGEIGELGDLGIELPAITAGLSPIGAAISAIIGAFVSWLLWSFLTYFIGTRLFEGQATTGEMLRVIGYAQAPQLLNILSPIPCLGAIISLVAAIWSIVAGFIGVRQGLDIDNTKTLVTVILSWLVAFLVNLFVLNPLLGLFL